MHMIDVFLEELAKVGGENLDETVLLCYLQTFLKVSLAVKLTICVMCIHYTVLQKSDVSLKKKP